MDRPKALLAWSSGKDSAFALHVVREEGAVEVVGLLTTVNDVYDRVAMHGVRRALLSAQAEAAGLPLTVVTIPSPCPNEVYEARMDVAMRAAKAQGIEHVVFGDLFLADIRAYRERQLSRVGMQGVFPLWLRDTSSLARAMIESGLRAHVVCIDPTKLDRRFAGRTFDETFLADLPAGVDPCGENGEFHSFAFAGPMFARPVACRTGIVVERDGFVFADVVPT
ncbi:MAG: adenine nucleotide alpha hydrolase [Alphaproteobacteria bacterium]|nr:adenine nucleotide alpha hydrolase [Alphaproteobacteria bacterium]